MDDPYEVLGIGRTATLAEAEAAYRRRLQEVHPDRHRDADTGTQTSLAAETRALNEAIRALRYELRPVRSVHPCTSCGAVVDEQAQRCPVCGADPGSAPWWRDAPPGSTSIDSGPPVGPWQSGDWTMPARGGSGYGVIVVTLLVLVAFTFVYWVIVQMGGG